MSPVIPSASTRRQVGVLIAVWLMLAGDPGLALEIATGGEVQVNSETARLADIVVPEDVSLDPSLEPFTVVERGRDRWLRPVVELTSRDGTSLAAELVRSGRALVSPDAAPDQLGALRALEEEARDARRGLWAQPRWRVQPAGEVRGETGDLVLVEGRVHEAAWAGDWLYVNFGADRQTDFTTRADRATVRVLARSGIEVKNFAGRNLRLRGWLMQVGGLMIEITGPAQVEVTALSKLRALVLLAPLAAGLAAGCTAVRNPATGETQYTSLTPEDEVALGRKESRGVASQFGGNYDSPELQAYLDRIGHRLAAVSELPDLKFTFTLLDTEIVNAFALPGGYVYVTRGLLALADNEAEIAGVMAHEIGHVTARHTAQRIDQAQFGQVGTAAATVIGALLLGQAGAQLGQQIAGTGAQAWVQGYSREQEFQADELGVRYLARAGYDPQAMTTFLGALEANDRLQKQLAGRGDDESDLSNWFASHPRTADRVQRAAAEAEAANPTGNELDRDRFLAAIDGILYGEDPDQGVIRGRTFIQPSMRVSFTVPAGFKLANTPTRVIAQDGKGRVIMIDAGQSGPGEDLARYMQEDWVKGRLSGLQSFDARSGPGVLGLGRLTINQQPTTGAFAVTRGAGDRVWRFLLFDQRGLDRGDLDPLVQTVRSTSTLSASEARAIVPLRVDVVTVGAGDTVDSLAAQMEVDQLPRETFMVLNDLDTRELRPGDKVKIVRRGKGPPVA